MKAIRTAVLAITLTGAGACGSNTPTIDAPNVLFTGELVDWDSSDASFCGVFMATMQVTGNASLQDSTNPNGRFQLMIPPVATTRVDITPPTAASQCAAGMPTYAPIPGLLVANDAVIAAGGFYSAREITMPRLTTFFAQIGTAYDATKAGVFVHVDSALRPVSIDAAHDATQAWDGTTWSAGDAGINVFFPNVTVGAGTTTVTMANATGTGAVPIVAGSFTYVTLIGN